MPFSTGVWGGGFFSSGGLPGEGGFGGFGWFSPPSISYASINVSGVAQRSTGVKGRGPGDGQCRSSGRPRLQRRFPFS